MNRQRPAAPERRTSQPTHRRQGSDNHAHPSRRSATHGSAKSSLSLSKAAYALFAIAIACEAVAHWSLGTFDEPSAEHGKAALFPLLAGAIGAPLGLCGSIAWLASRRRPRP